MPEAATAPPPAAPPAAPAAPAPPKSVSSVPAVMAKPVSRPAKSLADAYSQLDQMGQGIDPTKEDTAPTGPKDPPPPPGKTAQQANDNKKPEQDTEPTEKPEPKTEQTDDKTPEKAGKLRPIYEKLKADYAKLETKLKEIEAERAKPAPEDPERKKLAETLTAREKRLQELEDEIRFTNYERSDEYKEKYWKPYEKSYGDARATMADFDVTNEDGTVRAATGDDFDQIVRMEYRAAREVAKAKFPEDWQQVLELRKDVHQKNAVAREALDAWKKEGAKREAERAEAAKQGQKQVAEVFDREVKGARTKYKLFQPIEGDEAGNAMLDQGIAWADAAFSGVIKNAEGKFEKLPPAELAKLHAAIHNKAGAFDRTVHLLNAERAKVKELQAKLKEYEESGPGKGDGTNNKPKKPPVDTMEAALQGLEKLAR